MDQQGQAPTMPAYGAVSKQNENSSPEEQPPAYPQTDGQMIGYQNIGFVGTTFFLFKLNIVSLLMTLDSRLSTKCEHYSRPQRS